MDEEERAPLIPRNRPGPSSLRGPESPGGFRPGGFGGFGSGSGPLPPLPPLGPNRPASLPPGMGVGGESGDVHDHHDQFCNLVGVRPINLAHDQPHRAHPQSLYLRAVSRRQGQSCTYMFTATLINVMLLTQVVLGAALTGLGASNSSRVLITVFGALNTVIAGVVAFMKSRGQPMRARMFRDDLSRVVDEIENSAVMWYGISQGHHGYGAIDTDDQVTVRGEVARLTRLYDKAVKNNTMNDPDMYSAGGGADSFSAGLRKGGGAVPGPAAAPSGPAINTVAAVPFPFEEAQDDSPASKAPEPAKPKAADASSDKGSGKADAPAAAATPAAEDASPATDAKPATEATAPAADAKPAESPAATPAAEAPKDDAADKPAAEPVATPAPTPAPPAPAPVQAVAGFQDPDESPASSATPPKREASNKTLVDVN